MRTGIAVRYKDSTAGGPMRIRVGDPTFLIELRDLLRRAGCIAAQLADDTLRVAVPDAPSPEQELRELRAYLATWTAARRIDVELFFDSQ